MADALDAAHAAGIVHRDIKTGQHFVTSAARRKFSISASPRFRTERLKGILRPPKTDRSHRIGQL